MEIILFLVIAFVGWAIFRGYIRSKVGRFYGNTKRADASALASANAGTSDQPSWWGDATKREMFTHAIQKMMDRRGVAPEARKELFGQEYTRSLMLAHAASMERQGASFAEQQAAAAELAVKLGKGWEEKMAQGMRLVSTEDQVNEQLVFLGEFLAEYDQLPYEAKKIWASALWLIYEGFLRDYGSLKAFREAPAERKATMYALLAKDRKLDGEAAELVLKYRAFVSCILQLCDKFEWLDRPHQLDIAIDRLTEITEAGEVWYTSAEASRATLVNSGKSL